MTTNASTNRPVDATCVGRTFRSEMAALRSLADDVRRHDAEFRQALADLSATNPED